MSSRQDEINYYRSKGETLKSAIVLASFRKFINNNNKGVNMILNREAILNADDLKTETVNCPEWGGSVIVRGLTAGERDKWEASLYSTEKRGGSFEVVAHKENIRAKFIAASVVDEKGKLLFSAGDIEALSRKSAAPMDRLFAAAQRLSGMTDADVEELEKNLTTAQGDSSATN